MAASDDTGSFDVTIVRAEQPARLVLFAVGGGGDPERHEPLLARLAQESCTVVAPHVERLPFAEPSVDHLTTRARRLRAALDIVDRPDLPVVGVGHSIGAATLLALVGGQMWTRSGHKIPIATEGRLERLALLAPATGFFQAPGALDAVAIPIAVWAGTADTVTPLAQAEYLRNALADRISMTLHLVDGAGHFSFMDTPPPHIDEPLPNRASFLSMLAEEVTRAATA